MNHIRRKNVSICNFSSTAVFMCKVSILLITFINHANINLFMMVDLTFSKKPHTKTITEQYDCSVPVTGKPNLHHFGNANPLSIYQVHHGLGLITQYNYLHTYIMFVSCVATCMLT